MSNIEKHLIINREQLSEEFYFQSLLHQAYNGTALSDTEFEGIQMQCIKLLADNTERYNKGRSSSVRVERAQAIMASNLYAVGIYLKSLPDTSCALDSIRSIPVSELYLKGRRLIDTKLKTARHLYMLIERTKIKSPNHTYNATINEGLEGFFRQYDADFGAHEVPASIDYQLMNPVIGLAGVEYIIKYLGSLYLENRFCSKFDASAIHETMLGYSQGYQNLLVNISTQVLINAVGCSLLNKNALSLKLTPHDIQELENLLKGKPENSIRDSLSREIQRLVKTLDVTAASLNAYLQASLPELASRIHTAVIDGALQKVFVPRRDNPQNQIFRYSMGKKMDDNKYREIADEVLTCRYSEDKLQIIKKHIKSLADMEDILLDCELSQAEAFAVFDMLEDVEIALLTKRHSYRREIDAVEFTEGEIRLQRYLEEYLQQMPKDRLGQLQRMMSGREPVVHPKWQHTV